MWVSMAFASISENKSSFSAFFYYELENVCKMCMHGRKHLLDIRHGIVEYTRGREKDTE